MGSPSSTPWMRAPAAERVARFASAETIRWLEHQSQRPRTGLAREAEIRVLRDRYASLTPREREVMALVISGRLNKQVGGELGISEITVKAHRGKMMRKMKADSLADLVKMATRLGLARALRD